MSASLGNSISNTFFNELKSIEIEVSIMVDLPFLCHRMIFVDPADFPRISNSSGDIILKSAILGSPTATRLTGVSSFINMEFPTNVDIEDLL
jgi:hypothetical protein